MRFKQLFEFAQGSEFKKHIKDIQAKLKKAEEENNEEQIEELKAKLLHAEKNYENIIGIYKKPRLTEGRLDPEKSKTEFEAEMARGNIYTKQQKNLFMSDLAAREFIDGVNTGKIKVHKALVGTKNGVFVWYDGVWLDGDFNGLWIHGIFSGGTFKGTWKDGLFKNGEFLSGRFEGGRWKFGKWKSGYWDGEDWSQGAIWMGSHYSSYTAKNPTEFL